MSGESNNRPSNWHRRFLSRSSLSERYGRAAATWHGRVTKLGYLGAYADLANHALARFPALECGDALSVLDVGAGTGAFALAFATSRSRRCEITLLDRSPEMLQHGIQRLAVQGIATSSIVGNAIELQFITERYDVILCGHMIEHVADPVRTFQHMHQALRHGGIVLLSISKPHWCTRLLQLGWGHKSFDEKEVLHALQVAGFTEAGSFAFRFGPPSRTSQGYVAAKCCRL